MNRKLELFLRGTEVAWQKYLEALTEDEILQGSLNQTAYGKYAEVAQKVRKEIKEETWTKQE